MKINYNQSVKTAGQTYLAFPADLTAHAWTAAFFPKQRNERNKFCAYSLSSQHVCVSVYLCLGCEETRERAGKSSIPLQLELSH